MIRSIQQERLIAQSRAAGLAAYERGDSAAALEHLSYAFSYVKDDVDLNRAFAESRVASPTFDGRHLLEAIDLYANHIIPLLASAEVESNEERLDALDRLLDLYAQAGFRHEIIRTAGVILKERPDNVRALGAQAEAMVLEGSRVEAAPLLDRLMTLEPGNLRWRVLHLQTHDPSGATSEIQLTQWREWASEYGGDGRFELVIASILLQLDRVDEARDALATAADRGADDQMVLERAVELLDLADMRDRADALIAATVETMPNVWWPRETLVRRHWRAGFLEAALLALEATPTEIRNQSCGWHKMNALVMMERFGDSRNSQTFDDALLALNQCSEDEALRAWGSALAAIYLEKSLPWRIRMEQLQIAMLHQPHDAVLHKLRGDLWVAVGEWDKALGSYKQATTIDPQWVGAALAHIHALLAVNRPMDAHEVSRMLVTRAPRSLMAPALLYVQTYLASRRSVSTAFDDHELRIQVLDLIESIYSEQPLNAEVVSVWVEARAMLVSPAAAVDSINRVMTSATDAKSVPLLLSLAQVSADLGLQVEDALIERAVELARESPSVALAFANALHRKGEVAEAIAVLERAIQSFEDSAAPSLERLRIAHAELLLKSDPQQGRTAIAGLIDAYPQSVEVLQLVVNHGESLDASNNRRAVAALRELLGDSTPQVRLAEAAELLRSPQRDDAMLAKAIVTIEGVLASLPDSLPALSLMAEAAMQSRRPNFDRAIECLERAANLYQGESAIVLRLVNLLQQRGDFAKAGRYLRLFANTSGAEELRAAELRLWQNQGDIAVALQRASAAVNEDSPVAEQVVLANLYQQAGDATSSQSIFERLLTIQPPDVLAWTQAAEFFAQINNFDRGLSLLHQLFESQQVASIPHEVIIGSFHQRHGRISEAGEHFRLAVAHNPDSLESRSELAQHYLSIGHRSQARSEAMEGLKHWPEHAPLKAILAVASISGSPQERQESLRALQSLAQGDDELSSMLRLLNDIPVINGQLQPDESLLAQSRRLVNDFDYFLPAWHLAVTLHLDAGRVSEAATLARQAVGRFPAHPAPSQWATQALMEAGQWQAALAEAWEWRRRSIGSPRALIAIDSVIAAISLNLNRFDDAVAQLQPHAESLWNECEQFSDRLMTYLRALAFSGRYHDAEALMARLLEEAESSQSKWRNQWIAIARQLEPQYAAKALTLLNNAQLSDDEALQLAADWIVLCKRADRKEWLDHAQVIADRAKAHASPSQQAQGWIVQGGIHEGRGDSPAAELAYRRAIELQPRNAVALNNLAYLLGRDESLADEALTLAQQALQIAPNQPAMLDTLGRILTTLNRPAEAIEPLTRAVAAQPNELAFALSLAEAHFANRDWPWLERHLPFLHQRVRLAKVIDPDLIERCERLLQDYRHAQAAADTYNP